MGRPDVQQQLRITLEQVCAKIGRQVIAPLLPPEVGFTLVLFDYEHGLGQNLVYISSAERDGMVRGLEELTENLRRGSAPTGIVADLKRLEAEEKELRARVADLEAELAEGRGHLERMCNGATTEQAEAAGAWLAGVER